MLLGTNCSEQQLKIRIMKKVKFLSLLTFALGLAIISSTSAFSTNRSATLYYTQDGMGFRDVTNIVSNENYQCNDLAQSECLVQFSNDDPQTGIKTVIAAGEFEELS